MALIAVVESGFGQGLWSMLEANSTARFLDGVSTYLRQQQHTLRYATVLLNLRTLQGASSSGPRYDLLSAFVDQFAGVVTQVAGLEFVLALPSVSSDKNILDVPTLMSRHARALVLSTGTITADHELFEQQLHAAISSANNDSSRVVCGMSSSNVTLLLPPKLFELYPFVLNLKSTNVTSVALDLDILHGHTDVNNIDAFAPFLPLVASHWAFSPGGYAGETLAAFNGSGAAEHRDWLAENIQFRERVQREYHLPFGPGVPLPPTYAALKSWYPQNMVSPQVMLHDRLIFNRSSNQWTVPRFLRDVGERYGQLDSVLVWHSYPNIGVDDRSQFDMLESLPGGVRGVKALVSAFHEAGVRVLLPYNPWDTGTRRRDATADSKDALLLGQYCDETGADGFNGDTMGGVPSSFSVSPSGRHLLLEPELGQGVDNRYSNLTNDVTSWAYLGYNERSATDTRGWEGVAQPPVMSKYAWLYPPHQVHVCERWSRQHTNALQVAFFNGRGFVPWENVWGIFNAMSEGDGASLNRTSAVLRFFASVVVGYRSWIPFACARATPCTILNHSHTTTDTTTNITTTPSDVAVSQFSGDLWSDETHPGVPVRLWLMVNRRARDSTPQGVLSAPAHCMQVWCGDSTTFYDVWHGVELANKCSAGTSTVCVDVPHMGYGAVLALDAVARPSHLASLHALMDTMRQQYETRPLAGLSFAPVPQPRQVRTVSPSPYAMAHPGGGEMVDIPGGKFSFGVSSVAVEGWHGFPGVSSHLQTGVQFEWEAAPSRIHEPHTLTIKRFLIDKHPVTNSLYHAFLLASGYRPQFSQNFLLHWGHDATAPRGGTLMQPVRWVSLRDARAYCHYYGKRLPRDYEWALAAMSYDLHTYPWGEEWDPSLVPVASHGNDMGEPEDVGLHPGGASSFGVEDLVAHIWQWTDEFCDEHTCRGVVRGGNWYQPFGSIWYFPQAYKLTQHNTLLLLSESMDRSGGVGFRCVQ